MTKHLQDWLVRQAERRPDACALVFNGKRASYGELDEASNRLSRALQAVGCRRGDRVALLLPKSIQAIIAMFATLKADCTYVPLDTASPPARLVRILQDCESRCLLAADSTATVTKEIFRTAAIANSTRIGWLDGNAECGVSADFSWSDVQRLPASAPDSVSSANDAAHILFTSGSTGAPKGVVITHSNVIHFVEWALPFFGITSSDRISGHPPLHFDLSTFDIYGTVAAGAQLHLLPPELNLLPHQLAAYIRDAELTQWFSVPSILHHMAKSDVVLWNDFPGLQRLLWCGEKFPTPALIYWMGHLPHTSFFNLYGPTEATIASSYYPVRQCPADETAEIPIGEPCGGEQLFVLDEQLQPVAAGKAGDLYIGGVGLSPGYWNDPAKTGQVFLKNPLSADPADRMYKTGDLARMGNDGLVYLIGRSDSQIKSRGYRIELGEIEAAVHALSGIRDAAVVAVDAPGFEGTTICCAYVPFPGCELSPRFLRKQLVRVLPNYMLPACWLVLERMPRNGNGKTDRPRLREQFVQRAASTEVSAGAAHGG
jgi:amino acid adenylation domain-containing protein